MYVPLLTVIWTASLRLKTKIMLNQRLPLGFNLAYVVSIMPNVSTTSKPTPNPLRIALALSLVLL